MESVEEELARVKQELKDLKAIVLEMKEVIKVLTEGEERAREFVLRIEELAQNINNG